MMAFKFERLKVWQKAVALSDMVNQVVKEFPVDERYVLTSQIKRAADSVSLNIAEGSTGQTNPEQKKFIGYAIRSDVEVVGCLHLARSRGYIQHEDFEKIYRLCEELLVMLNGLRDSLKD
jgi:four helix bundle protein